MNAPATIGHYKIAAKLGEGGMGAVYRATDTKLGREVAIKVLPEALASNPDRLARFTREARVLASLNHPNIAQIYGVEESGETRAIVMELVAGSTLSVPQPLETALNYAKQIADALEAAHEKGITHRDLKPGNIMVTPEGVVKVLDFGLASVPSRDAAGDPTDSPTITMAATQAGCIMGTAGYMSPEQAGGKPVDRRADIWSFGVVLWEMLTGRRMFEGETVSHTLAAVLTQEPDLEPAPVKVRRLLQACLQKDARKRLKAIGDWQLLLDDEQKAPAAATVPSRRSPLSYLGWIVAALLAVALAAVSFRHLTEDPPRVTKTFIPLPEKTEFKPTSLLAVSPDGRRVAFVATRDGKDLLWLRDLDSLAASPLTGTEDASRPFWSPDSRTIGFFVGHKLKKIEVSGGPASTICDIPGNSYYSGTWSKDGVILFRSVGAYGGLFRVSATGGSPTPAMKIDAASGESYFNFPWFLPDGRHFLYGLTNSDPEKSAVYIGALDSKDRKKILEVATNVVYAPPGYLLFARERTLIAQPFDMGKLETTGDAVAVAEQVDSAGVAATGVRSQFSASLNGVLVYTSGGAGEASQLTWFDRSGKPVGLVGERGFLNWGAISPDGRTVAVDRVDPQTGHYDIWLHDLERGTASRFTFGPTGNNEYPIWSPDSTHIAFWSSRDGIGRPFQKAVTGAAQEGALSAAIGDPPHNTRVEDWSRDGRYLIEGTSTGGKTGFDVWVQPLFSEEAGAGRKTFPFLQTEFSEIWAKLSPNGQWLAYTSDESKRNEIYVQTFPAHRGKWQISNSGGSRPIWSRDGKELYFIGADGKMMAVEIRGDSKSGTKFEAGVPKPLFEARFASGVNSWFDVANDGRFLIPVPAEQTTAVPMTVVLNWQAGLKK